MANKNKTAKPAKAKAPTAADGESKADGTVVAHVYFGQNDARVVAAIRKLLAENGWTMSGYLKRLAIADIKRNRTEVREAPRALQAAVDAAVSAALAAAGVKPPAPAATPAPQV